MLDMAFVEEVTQSMIPHIREVSLIHFLGGVREGDRVPQHHHSVPPHWGGQMWFAGNQFNGMIKTNLKLQPGTSPLRSPKAVNINILIMTVFISAKHSFSLAGQDIFKSTLKPELASPQNQRPKGKSGVTSLSGALIPFINAFKSVTIEHAGLENILNVSIN